MGTVVHPLHVAPRHMAPRHMARSDGCCTGTIAQLNQKETCKYNAAW